MAFNEDRAVGRLAELIALACGLDPAKARQIRIAATLHDVGKQKICPALLSKPGKLTEAEFEVMKTHTTLGAAMLESLHGELGEMARNMARWHHEAWDGSGYWGKFLCELPFYVEIVGIADTFTALVSARPYKHSWPPEEALAYIRSQADTRFNPLLVDIFVPLVRHDSRVAAIFEPVV
jgi:putative two-component system response regulator